MTAIKKKIIKSTKKKENPYSTLQMYWNVFSTCVIFLIYETVVKSKWKQLEIWQTEKLNCTRVFRTVRYYAYLREKIIPRDKYHWKNIAVTRNILWKHKNYARSYELTLKHIKRVRRAKNKKRKETLARVDSLANCKPPNYFHRRKGAQRFSLYNARDINKVSLTHGKST